MSYQEFHPNFPQKNVKGNSLASISEQTEFTHKTTNIPISSKSNYKLNNFEKKNTGKNFDYFPPNNFLHSNNKFDKNLRSSYKDSSHSRDSN